MEALSNTPRELAADISIVNISSGVDDTCYAD